MSWLVDNLPVISGSIVAVLSILISLLRLSKETDISSKKIKRLSGIVEIYNNMPENTHGKKTMSDVIDIEVSKFKGILTRKVNKANVSAVVVVSIVGGLVSYGVALWATSVSIIWAVILWIAFSFIAFFTIGLVAVGLASVFEEDKEDKDK